MTREFKTALTLGLLEANGLTDWSVAFDESTQRRSTCRHSRQLITFSDSANQEDILHSVAHALAGTKEHDARFVHAAKRIGANSSGKCDPLDADFVATCSGCGKEFYRSKLPEPQNVKHFSCDSLLTFA